MKTYKTGVGPQDIKLMVDITTIGMAASRASISTLPVGDSKDASGDIATKAIGSAASCADHTLTIMTKVDLAAIPGLNERKAECDRITSTITLDGGIDGFKMFSKPDIKEPSDDYKAVVMYTQITLTK